MIDRQVWGRLPRDWPAILASGSREMDYLGENCWGGTEQMQQNGNGIGYDVQVKQKRSWSEERGDGTTNFVTKFFLRAAAQSQEKSCATGTVQEQANWLNGWLVGRGFNGIVVSYRHRSKGKRNLLWVEAVGGGPGALQGCKGIAFNQNSINLSTLIES